MKDYLEDINLSSNVKGYRNRRRRHHQKRSLTTEKIFEQANYEFEGQQLGRGVGTI